MITLTRRHRPFSFFRARKISKVTRHQRRLYNTIPLPVNMSTFLSRISGNSASGFWWGQVRLDVFVQVSFSRRKICCCLWAYSFQLFCVHTITTPLEVCFRNETSGRCKFPGVRNGREHQTFILPARWSVSHWKFRGELTTVLVRQHVFIKEASEKGKNMAALRLGYPWRSSGERCIHLVA